MDYEEKYKTALERATQSWECGDMTREHLEYLFPELAEPEDEKIRKMLIEFFGKGAERNSSTNGISDKDILAWLEKQESLTTDEEKQGKEDVLWCIKQAKKYAKDENEMGTCWFAEQWLEKQGNKPQGKKALEAAREEKVDNANKVEPKFKVGDFIVNDYCGGKVVEITNDAYLLDTEQGIPFSYEHNAHLWIIDDARDGDILTGKIDGDSYILIFKQVKDGWVETYGHYYDSVDRFCVPSQLFCRDYQGTFIPATKEQRDLLFQKMKEEGYEWDAEKKKLKKIEQKQKWSEEDEQISLSIEQVMNCAALLNIVPEKISRVRTWLQSLKQRATWKPTEEQLYWLKYAANSTSDTEKGNEAEAVLKELYEQLKRL